MRIRDLPKLLKLSVRCFLRDDVMSLSAGLAFYTILSLAPALLLVLFITSWFSSDAQAYLVAKVHSVTGEAGRDVVQAILDNAKQQKALGGVASLIGLGVIAFSATAVFAHLQKAMNRIWNVQIRSGHALWGWARKRLLSLLTILILGVLLLASLTASTAVGVLLPGKLASWGDFLLSLIVFWMLFALTFKLLPDVRVPLRGVLPGAAVTAVLFTAGKYALGRYFAFRGGESVYGAASSFAMLLIWIYYSSIVVFFGGELTKVYVRCFGPKVRPSRHAEWDLSTDILSPPSDPPEDG